MSPWLASPHVFWQDRAMNPENRASRFDALAAFFALWHSYIIDHQGDSEAVKFIYENLRVCDGILSDYYFDDRYLGLPELARKLIQHRYTPLFNSLSVRARNTLADFSKFENILPYVFLHKRVDHNTFARCGIATAQEINIFLRQASELFEDMLSGFDSISGNEYGMDSVLEQHFLKASYPFLSMEECAAVHQSTKDGNTPVLYICRRYLNSLTEPRAMVYRTLNGLSDTASEETYDTLAMKLGVTRERIRQLANSRICYPVELQSIIDTLQLPDGDFYPDYHPFIATELRKGLDATLSPAQVMALICSMTDDYTVAHLPDTQHYYLLRRSMLANVKLRSIFRQIESRIKCSKLDETTIDIKDIILENLTGNISDADIENLLVIFMDAFSDKEGVEALSKTLLRLKATKFNIIKALEGILEEHGESMDADEIYEAFTQKYPAQDLQISAMRSYISRSERIVPLGRNSIYALSDWERYFHGSISDYIYKLLCETGAPMDVTALSEAVRSNYGPTSEKNISALLCLDTERFVRFSGGMVGIVGRDDEAGIPVSSRPPARTTFTNRLDELKLFVYSERRLPMDFNDDEASLRRWMTNAMNGILDITPQQRNELDIFLRECEDLPTSKRQLKFAQNCREIKLWICRHGRVPRRADNPQLTTWLWSALRSEPWGDCRDRMIMSLKEFIRAMDAS